MAQGLHACVLGIMLAAAPAVSAQQSASPRTDDAAKIVLPSGFTTQESTIGQEIRFGDRRQYGGPAIQKSPGLKVLADFRGMSLYIFDGDKTPGKSACVGPCVADFSPVAAPMMAMAQGDWTVFQRDDGTRQWAYKGKPLYVFVRDTKAGDTNAHGRDGQWHAATP